MANLLDRSKRFLHRTTATQSPTHPDGPFFLNEAVNFEKRCIFIAVPKTGTTSVRTQIRQDGRYLIHNPHLDILQVRDALYVYYLREALGRNRSFPTEATSSDAALRQRAARDFGAFFKFSAVRNPWARAVSLFFRREGVQSRDDMTFEAFCDRHLYASDTCFHPTLHRNQLDWHCDEQGVCLMDYVYKVEHFEAAIREIAERTEGRLRLESRAANKNPGSPSEDYRSMYTDRTRKLIGSRFEKDIDYFEYTF